MIPFKGANLACAPHPSPYESDSSKWPAKLTRVSENDASIAAALVEVEDEVTVEDAKMILNLWIILFYVTTQNWGSEYDFYNHPTIFLANTS